MSAIVTDQFRILNANNFVESVENTNNSYYVFVGLANPTGSGSLVGYGRSSNWNSNTPSPIDSFTYRSHTSDTMMFGKKVSSANIRRIIRRIDWTSGNRYEIYRDDYSASNPSPLTAANRLYDANYYVLNSDFKVYICIDNGSTGDNPLGNVSQDEPTFTDLEPSKAGNSGDGYIWKYLFTVSPSDIIKFDSTEFITVPNDWSSSTDSQIRAVRENGDSSVNENQIKHVFIEKAGSGYANGLSQEVDIIGDGTGAKARVDVVNGSITDVTVSAGGKGYSYGLVDLGTLNSNVGTLQKAKLIPIIPPKLGHGNDVYTELGTDRVIVYARFDDSTKDFPIDTKFSQVGIVKNPTKVGTAITFTNNTYSSLQAVKFSTVSNTPQVGEEIRQVLTTAPNTGKVATGFVASYDVETKVLKYFKDRSLQFNKTTYDHTDYAGISTSGRIYEIETGTNANNIEGTSSTFNGSIQINFSGITTNPTGNKLINLGTNFVSGLSDSEINKGSGEIVYLDNRPLIVRNSRQKEDIKIILEF
mgnify:FL=1|tara:strand:- start:7916 stop:9505 length:1590 start_codon:yes stop_codon:yes gene_type:complete